MYIDLLPFTTFYRYYNIIQPKIEERLKYLISFSTKILNSLNRISLTTLTDKGQVLAQKIYERHTVLSKVLMMLGVDEETAAEDACKIEHVISDKSFESLKKYLEDK